jgi:hypothetical protein
MKASELRLGNLVSNMNPRHNDSILTIESIGDNHEVNVFYRKYLLSELEPIPLTEEWLLKFGWVKSKEYQYYWSDSNVIIDLNHAGYSCLLCGITVSLKHVHELQNLYFALTGEELTLNQEL